VLNLLQCYAVQFEGSKAGQQERGSERASFQLVRDGCLGFLEPMLFEAFGEVCIASDAVFDG
jgi:hypothetical protein